MANLYGGKLKRGQVLRANLYVENLQGHRIKRISDVDESAS